MKLEIENINVEFYIASMALGILEGMKQSVIHSESGGVWSSGRSMFSQQVQNSLILSDSLKYTVGCFDEINMWVGFENSDEKQFEMINKLIQIYLECLKLQIINNDNQYHYVLHYGIIPLS